MVGYIREKSDLFLPLGLSIRGRPGSGHGSGAGRGGQRRCSTGRACGSRRRCAAGFTVFWCGSVCPSCGRTGGSSTLPSRRSRSRAAARAPGGPELCARPLTGSLPKLKDRGAAAFLRGDAAERDRGDHRDQSQHGEEPPVQGAEEIAGEFAGGMI